MLEINNFTKKYNKNKIAVENLNLVVEDGDLFGFIGHNGAGKSTTIKSIVGLMSFDEGNIILNGVSIKDSPIEVKKMSGYVPDNPDLYDSLTGITFLNFIADIFDMSEEDRKENIEYYAELLEIKDALSSYISTYSHGMKQKLAIIAALIHHPKLLILDEPFVGLDPIASHKIKELMKEFCANGGSIFFSTHVLEVAEKLCNKIAIIKQGKLITSGKIEDVIKDSSLEDVFMELTDAK